MPTLLRPSGLLLKLAAFFLLCGVPALLAMDAARTVLEFRQIVRVLDSARIGDEIRREAQAIGRHRRERGLNGIGLTRDLERWLLTLTQPSRSPFGETAFSLLEYGPQPFVAMLVDANERPLATTRADFVPPLPLGPADGDGLRSAATNSPHLQRLYHAPLQGPNGAAEALVLWVDLPRPSERIWRSLSFEWPIVLVGALVFATVAAVFLSAWVTRRLRRIAATADAWRHGRFDLRIDDRARDEIGELAQQLDTMPSALAELVEHRSERAGRHERERIARDLHDTIKQQAFALSMQLGALRAALPEAQRDLSALGEARALAEQIQRELAELLGELRPLRQAEWQAHLVARVEDWSRRSGIPAHIELDATELIAASRHDVLMRVIDEALANIARHSGADRALVRLSHEARRFSLCVQDNGRGGIVEGSGRGLQHLRERAAALPEGCFDWYSDPQGGSRIELHWTETVT
ncbi:MAG: HAMP domain-containing protein [Rhodanobacteraceae bacterium]|nr:HAMP domain-containing protein [Rhodanobacteraceae bacterium]MBL0042586.1 HAMP domain-containing protein [Xanthomonadales bacterium]MBP6079318.1 HAMP domain-containing protein [Xanthomonadales bacterium]MBP7622738.1 HAMP domain-containing protein [Xanthomonadales bacterium]